MSKPMKSQIIQWFLYEAMKQIQGDWEVTWPPLGGGSLVAVAGGMCQGEAWAWLRALALLLLLNSSVLWASESPDRECCEPLYPFIPPPLPPQTTATPTSIARWINWEMIFWTFTALLILSCHFFEYGDQVPTDVNTALAYVAHAHQLIHYSG